MHDYTGKTIFVGLDVHKKTYAVVAVCDEVIIKRDTLKASPQVLIAYLKKRFGSGKIKTAYEAGFCGFHLHRALESSGIDSIVVHAASIEVSKDRVKTDKRDALKIATHLSQGRLKGIHVPTMEQEDQRTVTRLRNTYAKEKTRTACRIKSLLYMHGLIQADDKRVVSERWIRSLSSYELTPGAKFCLGKYIEMWLEYNKKSKK